MTNEEDTPALPTTIGKRLDCDNGQMLVSRDFTARMRALRPDAPPSLALERWPVAVSIYEDADDAGRLIALSLTEARALVEVLAAILQQDDLVEYRRQVGGDD